MFQVFLNGKSVQKALISDCGLEQQENINQLVNLMLRLPVLLDPLEEIFRVCYDLDQYTLKSSLTVKNWEGVIKSVYDIKKFEVLIDKIYKISKNVGNDIGFFLERLYAEALKEEYKNYPDSKIEYDCQVTTHCDTNSKLCYSISPKNIDVCGTYQQYGDFVECKKGMNPIDDKIISKFTKLSELNKILEKASKTYKNLNYQLRVFVLCSESNNKRKMDFYERTWTEIPFMGTDSFRKMYCTN